MGRDTLIDINFDVLNDLLNAAYELGRENENRMERGIPELDPKQAFEDWLDKYLPTCYNTLSTKESKEKHG